MGWGVLLATAVAQTQIRVEPLLGEMAETTPYPLRIEFRQGGQPTEGKLMLRQWRHHIVEYPVSLPANARKAITISLPDGIGWAKLLWHTPSRPAEVIELPYPEATSVPVVIVGDIQGGFQSLSAFVHSKQDADTENPIEQRWHPVYWAPEAVPDDWQAIAGIPVIVLVDGAERLNAKQWLTLTMWMQTGGHLIIAYDGVLKNVLSLTPLAPLARAVEESVAINPAETDQIGERWNPFLWHYHEGSPLFAQRAVVYGQLTLFFGDLTAPKWRNISEMRKFWEMWLASSKLPPHETLLRIYHEVASPAKGIPSHPIHGMMVTVGLLAVAVVFVWWRLRALGKLASAVPYLIGVSLMATGAMIWVLPPDLHVSKARITQILFVDKNLSAGLHAVMADMHLRQGIYTFAIPSEMGFLLEGARGVSKRIVHAGSTRFELFSRGASQNRLLTVEMAPSPVRAYWKGEMLILEAVRGAFRSEPILAREFSPSWLNRDWLLSSPKKRVIIPREALRHERAVFVQMEGIDASLSLPMAIERGVTWVWVGI